MKNLKPGKYQHYKGKIYEVIGLAVHTETEERMVLYRACYELPDLRKELGHRPYFVRPFEMFVEHVNLGGERIPRFRFIGAD